MATYKLTLHGDGGQALTVGEWFEWKGDIYSLDKINAVNAKITHVGNGKKFNLNWQAIENYGLKREGGTPFARMTGGGVPRVPARDARIKPGMVVTYEDKPGLWVVLKYQVQTDRFDIVALGGDPQDRPWAWRTPGSKLTPVDAINNAVV